MSQMRIGSVFKKLLEDQHISLKEVSVQTSIPYSTLHTWLQNSPPKDINKAKRLASFFGISLDHLLFGEETTAHFQSEEPKIKRMKEDFFKGVFEITVRKVE